MESRTYKVASEVSPELFFLVAGPKSNFQVLPM